MFYFINGDLKSDIHFILRKMESIDTRLANIEKGAKTMATKEQVDQLQADLTTIKEGVTEQNQALDEIVTGLDKVTLELETAIQQNPDIAPLLASATDTLAQLQTSKDKAATAKEKVNVIDGLNADAVVPAPGEGEQPTLPEGETPPEGGEASPGPDTVI